MAKSYNTNLASEFFVLSTLARLGQDASLTLGNKKKVDIVVTFSDGKYITLDVKGVEGANDWFLGDREPDQSPNHFYVFVTYDKKIHELNYQPRTWIIPSEELKGEMLKVASNGKTHYVWRKFVLETLGHFAERWDLISES